MKDSVQIVAVAVSAVFLLLVLELVRRRKLTDEHSIIWSVGAAALLALSLWRNALDVAAQAIGVHYPPALLLLALTAFVFLVSLYFSVAISRQRHEIERLLEELALLEVEVRQLRRSDRAIPSAEVVPRAAGDGRQPSDARGFSREQDVTRVQPDDQSAA